MSTTFRGLSAAFFFFSSLPAWRWKGPPFPLLSILTRGRHRRALHAKSTQLTCRLAAFASSVLIDMLIPIVPTATGADNVQRQAVAGPVILLFDDVGSLSSEDKRCTQSASTWAIVEPDTSDDFSFAALHGGLDVVLLNCSASTGSAEPRVANSAQAGITRNRLGCIISAESFIQPGGTFGEDLALADRCGC